MIFYIFLKVKMYEIIIINIICMIIKFKDVIFIIPSKYTTYVTRFYVHLLANFETW